MRRVTHRVLSRAMLGAAFAAVACVSVGCSGIRNNPTPELRTLAHTSTDVLNYTTVTFDTNLRALVEDFARLTLTDRPSRLTNRTMPW